MKLVNLIAADFLKQKRSLLWIFVFIIPLGTTAAMFLDMHIRFHDYLYPLGLKEGLTSWDILLLENHKVLGWGFFLPLFVACISAFIHYTEYKEDSWKSLLSLSVTRSEVYVSKLVIIAFFSFLLISLNTIGLIGVGVIIGFPEEINIVGYSKYVMYQLIGVLAVVTLHNWISSYYKNLVTPVVIGFVGMIVGNGIYLRYPNLSVWFPYNLTLYADGLKGNDPMVTVYGGVLFAVIFMVLGMIEFRKRDIL